MVGEGEMDYYTTYVKSTGGKYTFPVEEPQQQGEEQPHCAACVAGQQGGGFC